MIVIGRFPIYISVGVTLGARIFNIPPDKWNTMTPDEQWALNKEFLDKAIMANEEIRLATPPEKVPSGSTLEKELNYLASHGYLPKQIGIDHWEVVREN
jgi:hypothetical protein